MSTPQHIGVRELRGKLSHFLRAARRGERFVIVSRGQPIAEIGAPTTSPAPVRSPGGLKGAIWMADDFDDWPDDVLDAIEGP